MVGETLALGYRIREARGAISQKKASSMMGVGITTLQRWEKCTNSPSADSLMLIARTFKVDPCWLLVGEGDSGIITDAVDTNFLSQIIEAVEVYISKEGLKLSPDKKAGLISLLYDHFKDEGKIDQRTFARFLNLVK